MEHLSNLPHHFEILKAKRRKMLRPLTQHHRFNPLICRWRSRRSAECFLRITAPAMP
jgi:hypothetical protein